MTAAAEPPATKPVVHSFPSDLVEAEAAQRAKEDIRRKVEAELVAALTSLETAKNAKSFGGSDKENSETGGDSTKLKDELARTKEELNGCRFLLRDAQNALADEAAKTEQANKAAERWEGEASKLRDELASVRDELDKARVATAAAQGFVKRHQEMQRKQQQAAEMVRQAEELKLAVESQAATVEPPSAEVPEEPSAPVEENMRHPPPPPRSPARAAPKPGEDAFPKVDVEKVKLAREVAKQTQEALRAQEAAIEQINKLVVENARLGKELAEEKKKTGALENIGQDIGQAFKGWWS
jgi:chromosome segregation ATPase